VPFSAQQQAHQCGGHPLGGAQFGLFSTEAPFEPQARSQLATNGDEDGQQNASRQRRGRGGSTNKRDAQAPSGGLPHGRMTGGIPLTIIPDLAAAASVQHSRFMGATPAPPGPLASARFLTEPEVALGGLPLRHVGAGFADIGMQSQNAFGIVAGEPPIAPPPYSPRVSPLLIARVAVDEQDDRCPQLFLDGQTSPMDSKKDKEASSLGNRRGWALSDVSPGQSTATPPSVRADRRPLANMGPIVPGSPTDESPRWAEEPALIYVDGVPIGSSRCASPGGRSGASGQDRDWGGDHSPLHPSGRVRSPQRCWPRTPSSCASPTGATSPGVSVPRWPHTPSSTAAPSPNTSPSPRRKARGVAPAALDLRLRDIFGTQEAHPPVGEGLAAAPVAAALGSLTGAPGSSVTTQTWSAFDGLGRTPLAMHGLPHEPGK